MVLSPPKEFSEKELISALFARFFREPFPTWYDNSTLTNVILASSWYVGTMWGYRVRGEDPTLKHRRRIDQTWFTPDKSRQALNFESESQAEWTKVRYDFKKFADSKCTGKYRLASYFPVTANGSLKEDLDHLEEYLGRQKGNRLGRRARLLLITFIGRLHKKNDPYINCKEVKHYHLREVVAWRYQSGKFVKIRSREVRENLI